LLRVCGLSNGDHGALDLWIVGVDAARLHTISGPARHADMQAYTRTWTKPGTDIGTDFAPCYSHLLITRLLKAYYALRCRADSHYTFLAGIKTA
jgi:hypothetical protein